MDGQFLQFLLNFDNRLGKGPHKAVLKTAKMEFGTVSGLGLETLFNRLVAKKQFAEDLGEASLRQSESERLARMKTRVEVEIEALVSTIVSVYARFSREAEDVLRTPAVNTSHHIPLVTRLTRLDTVLSFNYDTIIDSCIKALKPDLIAKGQFPYGASHQDQVWIPRVQGWRPGGFRLLKAHGSVNFRVHKNKKFKNTIEVLPPSMENIRPLIVAPAFEKNVFQNALGRIWRRAALQLDVAKAVVVLGYSCPPADYRAAALLGTSLGAKVEPLSLVVVVNPSEADRSRIIGLIGRRINADTKVFELESFEKFENFLLEDERGYRLD